MGKEPTLRKVKILLHVEAAQRLSDEQKTLIESKEIMNSDHTWSSSGGGLNYDNLLDIVKTLV